MNTQPLTIPRPGHRVQITPAQGEPWTAVVRAFLPTGHLQVVSEYGLEQRGAAATVQSVDPEQVRVILADDPPRPPAYPPAEEPARRTQLVNLLRASLALDPDPGSQGYTEGMIERIAHGERFSPDYLERVRAGVLKAANQG